MMMNVGGAEKMMTVIVVGGEGDEIKYEDEMIK